jgi:hypothetical protein
MRRSAAGGQAADWPVEFSRRVPVRSVEGLPVAFHPDRLRDGKEQQQRPELRADFEEPVALEQDAANDPEEMG